MSVRPEKRAMVAHIRECLSGADYVFLADFSGMTVGRMTELRRRLRPVTARLQVTPNALLERAAQETGWNDLSNLVGPTAVIAGRGDVTEAAKVLTGFVEEFEKPLLKGGRLGSRTLSPEQIAQLARLPSRPVLWARLLGVMTAPARGLVGVLHQKVASLLYVLKAVEEKKANPPPTAGQ